MIGVRPRRFTARAPSTRGAERGVDRKANAPMIRASKALTARFIDTTTVAVLFLRNAPIVK